LLVKLRNQKMTVYCPEAREPSVRMGVKMEPRIGRLAKGNSIQVKLSHVHALHRHYNTRVQKWLSKIRIAVRLVRLINRCAYYRWWLLVSDYYFILCKMVVKFPRNLLQRSPTELCPSALTALKTEWAAVVCWPVVALQAWWARWCSARTVCPVRGCAAIRNAGEVYSLRANAAHTQPVNDCAAHSHGRTGHSPPATSSTAVQSLRLNIFRHSRSPSRPHQLQLHSISVRPLLGPHIFTNESPH
jgi:hypothetical protein